MPPPNLVELQQGLLDLIKQRRALTCDDHPYLHQVAASPRLVLIRSIAEWWRESALIATAPLTMALLERRGILEEEVSCFTAALGLDPHPRTAARSFLIHQAGHPDPLVAAVAEFESALHAVRLDGSLGTFRIYWPCHPLPVLNALLHGHEIIEQPPGCTVEVSADIAEIWQVA